MKDIEQQKPSRLHTATILGLGLAAAFMVRKLYMTVRKTSLQGKVVLVTGGARGLGLAIAKELADKGARLVLCSRNAAQLAEAKQQLVANGCDVLPIQTDLTDKTQVQQMMDKIISHFGGLDILINNAGIMIVGPENVMGADDYKSVMESNLWSALYTIEAAMPHFRKQGAGHIVNICSIGGKIAVPHMLPYSVSKFALVGLSQGLSSELSKEHIKVTTVIPNLMRTGSPRNITVKGDHQSEYAWFKIADSLPFLSQSAKSAAKRIVEGIQLGEREITLTFTAKLAVALQAIMPGMVNAAARLANKILPESHDGAVLKGHESESEFTSGAVTQPTDAAAVKYNQY